MSKRKSQQTLNNSFFQNKNSKHLTGKFICPVCNIFEFKNNDILNLHVDICLSKQDELRKPIPIYQHNVNSNEILYQQESDLKKITNIDDGNNNNNLKETKDIGIVSIPNDIIIEKHNSIPGLYMVINFITKEEEDYIVKCIDNDPTPWHHSSFNGHTDQKIFGYRTIFASKSEGRYVRLNDTSKGEFDIPEYFQFLQKRLQKLYDLNFKKFPPVLKDFYATDCNINSYLKNKNHYLRPHVDDRQLSGEVLMNLSLFGEAIMTYKSQSTNQIPNILPRRSLQLVTGDARYKYTHEIKESDLLDNRRISVTFRQSTQKFSSQGVKTTTLTTSPLLKFDIIQNTS